LSLDEVVRYFGDSEQLANPDEFRFLDQIIGYDEARIAYCATELTYTYSDGTTYTRGAGRASWWWLRSPGYSLGAVHVRSDGVILGFGFGISHVGGVRPALWLNLE
jgi:hypothetical protein